MALVVGVAFSGTAAAFETAVQPLLDSGCIGCHNNTVLSPLDLTVIGHDLSDPAVFRAWERVYDRVERGDMPPPPMPPVDAAIVDPALGGLGAALVEANLVARGPQRTPLRRLTRLEYQYTIADLLRIDEEHARALAESLPAEADSGGFDTVAANQSISALHVRGYLDAADRALDIALDLGPPPEVRTFKVEYAKSRYLGYLHEGDFLGSGVTLPLDDAVATVGDIRGLDEDARGYIGSDQPLQASDLIFSRGHDLVERATAHVQAALQAQRTSRLDSMRAARATQARMMWTAAFVVVLSMLVLAPAGAAAGHDPSPDDEEYEVAESAGLSLLSLDSESAGDELDLPPAEGADAADGPAGSPAAGDDGADAVREPRRRPATPDLGATAALCTAFSNLTRQDQLSDLLARTAALMNASGLIVWVHNENARALQPVLGHGYAPGTLERIGSIPPVGANPTSTAFATGRIQTVESKGADKGALAAPLMVAENCIGVLSAELLDGWESSGAVQATASIVAAQLAPLLPADVPAASAPLPAAATGTHDTTGSAPATGNVTPSSS